MNKAMPSEGLSDGIFAPFTVILKPVTPAKAGIRSVRFRFFEVSGNFQIVLPAKNRKSKYEGRNDGGGISVFSIMP
ncbi:hypothetical protein NEIFLAOT_00985 [Neisseria flavescens NRL30031/H210]|uniref:Uncharacterized protein n=1 Tax=Neisseria flavescens NRL30031/H210 TaxID=546264 RepID=C0EM21_NEIFL|nr:hypothetical protein NEIFLAOT_00985 [Neisseria flavescens NRL30031/H210]